MRKQATLSTPRNFVNMNEMRVKRRSDLPENLWIALFRPKTPLIVRIGPERTEATFTGATLRKALILDG